MYFTPQPPKRQSAVSGMPDEDGTGHSPPRILPVREDPCSQPLVGRNGRTCNAQFRARPPLSGPLRLRVQPRSTIEEAADNRDPYRNFVSCMF